MRIPEQDFRGTERFSIQRRLGAGGFGIVYQAYDREQNGPVALKVLYQNNAEALYGFKQEFRALADVTHPNLVALYELISSEEQWFFTMELVEGMNFREYVRGDARVERTDPFVNTSTLPITSRDDVKPIKGNEPETLNSGINSGPESGSERMNFPADTSTLPLTPRVDVKTTQGNELEITRSEDSALEGQHLTVSPSQLDLDRLREALRQLAEGIDALHKAGKLHRDIKPSNVLVTREGRVVILDFGLVTELGCQDFRQSSGIIGTPAYMSPEQGDSGTVTEASDWYSVGVMLYEVLTGRLPFTGRFYKVLMSKQSIDPPAPSELVPGLPEDLNALCQALLCRDPEKRPSGQEVLRRLGRIEAEIAGQTASSPMRAVPLVGREHHLSELREAFLTTKQGQAMTVYVHGSSGMGKSALVRHFLEELQKSEPALVLAGRCYERESVPYKALDSLVDALSRYLKRLPPTEAEAFLPPDLPALARLFPVLRQMEVMSRIGWKVLEIPDSQELRRRAFTALRELLVRLADQRPLVLFIDDLQWGDVDSAALLSEFLLTPDPPRLLLIASYRSEEADTSPLLRELLPLQARAASAVQVRELAIGELTPLEAQNLASLLLGEDAQVLKASAEAIARESGGNPFFIDELVRYAQTVAAAAQTGDRAEKESDIKAGWASLDEVINLRVARLPEEARRLLEIVSVAGNPLKFQVAKRAAELGITAEAGNKAEGGGREAEARKEEFLPPSASRLPPSGFRLPPLTEQAVLAILRAGHLIRTRGPREQDEIETYHDRIREAVVAHLSPEMLRSCHHRLALAFEAYGQADPETLAVHFESAGDFEKAAKYVVAAAEQAAEALAFDRAARLYRLALELRSVETAKTRVLRVKLGDALTNAGRGVEAAEAYLAAAEGAEGAEAVELRRRAAEQLLRTGHIDEGLAVLRIVLGMVGMKLPETPRQALLSLLIHRAQIRLRGLRFRGRDAAEVSAEDLIRIDTCWSIATGLGVVDSIRGLDFQTRHLLLALRAGEPYRIVRGVAFETGFCASSGGRSLHRAEKLLELTKALAERLNHPHAIALAALVAGAVAFFSGRWQQAYEMTVHAEEILRERCTGVTWELDTTQIYLLRSLFYLGELNELSCRLPTLLKEAQERSNLYAETYLKLRSSCAVFLAADEPDQARQELRQAIAQWSQQGFHFQHYFDLIGQVEIALYSGQDQAAWSLLTEQWPALSRSLILRVQAFLIESLYLRARSALAAATQRDSDIKRHTEVEGLLRVAERDAKRIEREKMLWSEPLVRLIRAGIAATCGKVEEAAELLIAAETGFEASKMALYAAASRRRRGQLIGGDQGRALVEAADTWMASQKIKNPDCMTALLAPGKWTA